MAKKNGILSILILVALAVILLSASLSSLELRDGRLRPVAWGERQEPDPGAVDPPNLIMHIFLRVILLTTGILIPLSILYHLRSSQGRRRMLILCIVVLSFLFLKDQIPWKGLQLRVPKLNMPASLADKDQLPPHADRATPNPPWWIVFIVSLGLSALILGGGWFLWRRLRRRPSPLELVAKEAQKTIDELRDGADLKEGVIRCYYEMNKVLKEQRGLKRQAAMTTREFENSLVEIGLPYLQIRRLTRLFEKVRYGAKNLTSAEDREAIACLSAIVQACEGSL